MGACYLAVWPASAFYCWPHFCLPCEFQSRIGHACSRIRVTTHADSMPEQVLAEIASYFPDLHETGMSDAWHLAAIDSTRGHSRDRLLMHPSYVHAGDYWAFNQRPHGLGDRDFSFPTFLPQVINLPIVQAFLMPCAGWIALPRDEHLA